MAHLRGVLVRPWWHSPVLWIAIVALAATAVVLSANATVRNKPVVPSLPSLQGEVNQPVQQAPEVTAPVIKEWPKVQVVWSEPFLVSSLAELPPVEKGFYRGTADGEDGSGAAGTLEGFAYLQKIQPQLVEGTRCCLVLAGVARDSVDKNVAFAAFWVEFLVNADVPVGTKTDSYGYLFLSTDGEKTWHQISYLSSNGWDIPLDVRVVRNGDTLTLLVRDRNFVAPMWRKATLSLRDLP